MVNKDELIKQTEFARLKYKPENVKYLIIGEAPPNATERYFYYPEVSTRDHLFIGISGVLYPPKKEEYLSSGRNKKIKVGILEKFRDEGFYLLDLSELPLSLMEGQLEEKVPVLIKRIQNVINKNTRIILVKVNVYDLVFQPLKLAGVGNIIDARIPFPSSGQQNKFKSKFKKALTLAGYF